MSTERMADRITCDYCGLKSDYLGSECFTRVGLVDLCRWCAGAPTGGGVLESGRHRVTVTERTWTCSCGLRYRPEFLSIGLQDALPSVVGASASRHVNQ